MLNWGIRRWNRVSSKKLTKFSTDGGRHYWGADVRWNWLGGKRHSGGSRRWECLSSINLTNFLHHVKRWKGFSTIVSSMHKSATLIARCRSAHCLLSDKGVVKSGSDHLSWKSAPVELMLLILPLVLICSGNGLGALKSCWASLVCDYWEAGTVKLIGTGEFWTEVFDDGIVCRRRSWPSFQQMAIVTIGGLMFVGARGRSSTRVI